MARRPKPPKPGTPPVGQQLELPLTSGVSRDPNKAVPGKPAPPAPRRGNPLVQKARFF
jgi:hypothetical protein